MNRTRLGLTLCTLLLLLPLTACKQKTTSQEAAPQPTAQLETAPVAAVPQAQPEAAPAQAPPPKTPAAPATATVAEAPAAAPADQAPAPAAPSFPLNGTVAEVHNGGGYTYILLKTEAGEYWVATSEIEVTVGEKIGFAEGNVMRDFPSKAMNRTFPEIIFSASVIGKTPAAKPAAPAAAPGSFDKALQGEAPAAPAAPAVDPALQGSGKAIVPLVADVKVEKATGANAHTVGEMFDKAADLTGKTVVLRAKIMKVSPGIMGKTWLHVQDGTGDALKNTHDLVVTTAATPNKGDTVTLEGKLGTNRDFGAGYVYQVIVEDATIK